MNAKEYLQQIKTMDTKINTDIEELANLESLVTKTTSVMGDDRVQSSGSQEKMADCVAKIVDMQKEITDEIDRLIDYKKEARQLICDSCDADCTKLLQKRYFNFETWEQIAVEMNYTYQWVSGKLHKRALSQVQKALDGRKEMLCVK